MSRRRRKYTKLALVSTVTLSCITMIQVRFNARLNFLQSTLMFFLLHTWVCGRKRRHSRKRCSESRISCPKVKLIPCSCRRQQNLNRDSNAHVDPNSTISAECCAVWTPIADGWIFGMSWDFCFSSLLVLRYVLQYLGCLTLWCTHYFLPIRNYKELMT